MVCLSAIRDIVFFFSCGDCFIKLVNCLSVCLLFSVKLYDFKTWMWRIVCCFVCLYFEEIILGIYFSKIDSRNSLILYKIVIWDCFVFFFSLSLFSFLKIPFFLGTNSSTLYTYLFSFLLLLLDQHQKKDLAFFWRSIM